MLTFFNGRGGRYCDGLSRRGFLKAGTLAVGGLTLADLLRLRAAGPALASPSSTSSRRRPRAVIMICLGGGPSQLDTYDPKPDAPAEVRGPFKSIPTAARGLRFNELLPLRPEDLLEARYQRFRLFGTPGKQPVLGAREVAS